MLKRILALLAALTVATTAAVVFTAARAHAAAPPCQNLELCIYEDDWWGQDSNAIYRFDIGSGQFAADVCYGIGGAWNDRTQSARFNYFSFPGQYIVTLYATGGCGTSITSPTSGPTNYQMRTSCSSDGSWVGWKWNCSWYTPVISSFRWHHNT